MSFEVCHRLPFWGIILITLALLTSSIDASDDFGDNITRSNASLINATATPPATTRFMPTIANTTTILTTTTPSTASPKTRRPDDGGKADNSSLALYFLVVIGVPLALVLMCVLCCVCAVRRCIQTKEVNTANTTRRVSPAAVGGATTTVATPTPVVIVTVGSSDADGSNIESRNDPMQFEMVASAAFSAPTAPIANEDAGVVAVGHLVHDTFPYGTSAYDEPTRSCVVEPQQHPSTPISTRRPPVVRNCW